ncbi:LytR/AlgR family response regulator transcription factor [Desertivirga arenae]|uniref:LytR/AlgR family response regulator transcription factor n=1 Tax=Desertivirga arenae TaxID=2810309 RepID=UPI001A96A2EF|nr:LytTR family DNA-binding domain-containing protein [Pedobacter sp. SYSU D00823]
MKKLIIHSQDELRFVAHSEIVYCKSDNCYTSIHLLSGQEEVICKSLKKVSEQLAGETFIRVNQSYLVNKGFIKSVDKKRKLIGLEGDIKIPFTITINQLLIMILKQIA